MRRWIVCVTAAALGMAPAWLLAGDQETAQDIAAVIRDSGQLQGYSIAVKYKSGVALLSGRVQDAAQKQAAEQLALECDGVDQVINQLAVASSARKPLRQPSGMAAGQDQADSAVMQVSRTGEAPLDLSRFDAQATPAVRRMPLGMPSAAAPRVARNGNMNGRAGAVRTAAQVDGIVGYGAAGGAVVDGGVVSGGVVGGAGCPLPLNASAMGGGMGGAIGPGAAGLAGGAAPLAYDEAVMPPYAWPTYAAYPNYAAVTYPRQYSPTVWPFIGPFYPYPQVPLGWRKVTLEWDDGWWFLDFHNSHRAHSW